MEEIRHDRVMALVWHRLLLIAAASVLAALLFTFAAPLAGAALGRPATVSEAELDGGGLEAGRITEPLSANERRQATTLLYGATFRASAVGCGATVTGSGFAVERLILTNSHIVEDATSFSVDQPSKLGPNSSEELTVAVQSPGIDLAGSLTAGMETELWWSPDPAVAGQPVLLAGYGGGRKLSVIETTVHAVVDGGAYGSDGLVLLLDQAIVAGFSGGPVVDREGRVLGMLRAYDSLTGLSIATPTAMMLEATRSAHMHPHIDTCN